MVKCYIYIIQIVKDKINSLEIIKQLTYPNNGTLKALSGALLVQYYLGILLIEQVLPFSP